MIRRASLAAAAALASCAAPAPIPPAKAAPAPFVAMACNVRYGTADDGPDAWPQRRELLAARIASHAPAIVGLQEALDFQLAFLAERLPQYRQLGQGRDGGRRGEHTTLLVDRTRFAVLAHGDFWLSETPDQVASVGWDAALTRLCTWAHLRDLATGTELHVWNTHFDHRGAKARTASAHLLASRLAAVPGPHLVLGDFNAGEASPPLAVLRAAGLRDTFRDLHAASTAVGTFHAFRGGQEGDKIDYVLADAGFVTLRAWIDAEPGPAGRWPSDHHFVLAELQPTARD